MEEDVKEEIMFSSCELKLTDMSFEFKYLPNSNFHFPTNRSVNLILKSNPKINLSHNYAEFTYTQNPSPRR